MRVRAIALAKPGIRERVLPQVPAQGLPFDNGVFQIIEEPLKAPWPENDPLHFTAERIQWPEGWEPEPEPVEPVASLAASSI